MKTLGILLSALLVAAGLAISAVPEAMAGTTITMKAGTVIDPAHPYNIGIVKFGEIIGQKTNGRLKIELYHSSQLGNERDLVEGLGMGSVDLAAVSSAPVSSFIPKVAVFDLPYLFASREQAYKVMDGPIGQGFFKDLEAKNVIGLAYFENGFRNTGTDLSVLSDRMVYRLTANINAVNGQNDLNWDVCNDVGAGTTGTVTTYSVGEALSPNISSCIQAIADSTIDNNATWWNVLQDCCINMDITVIWDCQNQYQAYTLALHVRNAGLPNNTYVLANTPTYPKDRTGNHLIGNSTVTPVLALTNTGQHINLTVPLKAAVYVNASASLNINQYYGTNVNSTNISFARIY